MQRRKSKEESIERSKTHNEGEINMSLDEAYEGYKRIWDMEEDEDEWEDE